MTVNRWQFSSRVSFGYVTQRKLDGSEVVEDLSFHEFLWATDIRYEAAFLRNLYIHILPVIGSRFHYDVRSAGDPVEYEYMFGGFGLGAEFNRVDWVGFLRRGWNAGLLNYYWIARDAGFVQKNTITGRVSLHLLAGRDHAVNPSFRPLAFYSFAHEAPSLGRYVRGVDADVMFGDRALILNTGLQFRIFGRDRIEVHLQPFVDMGLAVPEDTSVDWSRDFHAGVGSEMLLFFPTLPGLQIRGYAGVDLMVDDWSAPTKWNLGLSFDLLY